MQRAVLFLPFLRVDDAVTDHFKPEAVIEAAAAADDDRDIELHGQQADAFVGGGLAPEEIDKDVLAAAVLVGDDTQGGAGFKDVEHGVGGPFFVDNILALVQDVIDVPVDIGIVDGAGDVKGFHAQGGEDTAHDLEVAVVAGDQDDAAAIEQKLEDFGDIIYFRITVPGGMAHQAGGIEDVEGEHDQMLEAAAGGAFDPGGGFFRVAQPQVFQGTLPAPAIDAVEAPAQPAGHPQGGVDVGDLQQDGDETDHHIKKVVQQWIMLFFLLFLFRGFGHVVFRYFY
ncbi:MAG: hypothetical protein BWY71_00352 [Planctomycetes bacterium ADurb.Bin412]|nr:MAG: hypothetical protein BWY71_00352 [Planctomycetes bacterium ADurb.Bin412]